MGGKRPCQACGRSNHRLRDCPFRHFYDPGQKKASLAAPGISATKTPATSYAQVRLMAPTKRQRPRPLPSPQLKKPKSSPLAMHSETADSSAHQ
ncbi:hypothetical protein ACN38_g3048 [Penicillium nordicum]|uniref:CCHC-type domain-containing protein n=1 Tax=Penicillium nordicum TaxID=229535 RepID=A0A0M8P670_9EURO|nr:hypothetical protein ACN38_g3048 [Penicillium nordicum]